MIELEKSRTQLEALKLFTAANLLESRLQIATEKNMTYVSFISDLLAEELEQRHRRNIETKSCLAHLPYRKTLDEFDFSFQPSVDQKLIAELRTLNFINQAANRIFLRPPGVGKSHLAVALTIEANSHGYSADFITATKLIEDLRKAYQNNRLDTRMRKYLNPKLLVIDEVGYLPLDQLRASLFFQLINARYEQGSIILTSNKTFANWGELFGDEVLATAILDRLLHHSHIVNIRGQSYRLKDKLKAGVLSAPNNRQSS
ncbi:MAG: IS21-like element helper ATPase IstB [Candidatus Carbobacillus sp.]|nr:IS21-like element helper ATPase IstB [Candidatus Carbobacillus sp.]